MFEKEIHAMISRADGKVANTRTLEIKSHNVSSFKVSKNEKAVSALSSIILKEFKIDSKDLIFRMSGVLAKHCVCLTTHQP